MKLGFVINPLAGIGGAVALKGSDGVATVQLALERGAELRAEERAANAMRNVSAIHENEVIIYTAEKSMGSNVLRSLKLPHEIIYDTGSANDYKAGEFSSAVDTKNVIRQFIEKGVDLIIFAGGDGTARDVLDVMKAMSKDEGSLAIPVIGIPAGVKIHSAVYATTPVHAGELINLILSGVAVSLHESQVMDLDEKAFREGKVHSRCYGYLTVPVDDTRMQLIKQGGLNEQEITVQEIAADVIESMENDVFYLMGSGSTTAEVMAQLSLQNTLLGIDIVYNQELIASDVDEQTILKTINNHLTKIVITTIGGQGHIFGRGNQQLSSKVIRHVGRDNIIIIATNEKLRSLDKRPMISDTGDVDLDSQLAGLYSVITGYQQKTLYKLN
ncbi:MAG: ATP-NAD kinase family protein [Proteobacteria bacterium]|nr:ATP-NAD kinase family protein [Pseudomonadota bacterium]